MTRLAPVALVLLLFGTSTYGCIDARDEITDPADSLTVTVVNLSWSSTTNPKLFRRSVVPVADADVSVAYDGAVFRGKTGTAGDVAFPEVFPTSSATVDLLVHAPERSSVAVYGWAATRAIVPLATTAANGRRPVTSSAGESASMVSGQVVDWVPSELGQRSEARMFWRHVDGSHLPAGVPEGDLYARSGLNSGSGNLVCEEDPVSGEVHCYDPNADAAAVSRVAFAVPPGSVELGYVERVTDYESGGLFVETGGIYYDPAFAVPENESLGGLEFPPVAESDQTLCDNNALPGAMDLILDKMGREYVIRSRGAVTIALWLQSPLGLRLPFLFGEHWPQFMIAPVNATRQRVSLQYPFRLTGPLDGFTYGYRIEATSESSGSQGFVRYRFRTVAQRLSGLDDPCRTLIEMPTYETAFRSPTTAEPMRTDAEKSLHWQSKPTVPLRRLRIRDREDRDLLAEIWLLDPSINQIAVGAGLTSAWQWAPGHYKLAYQSYTVDPDLEAADTLIRQDVSLAEHVGSYFVQEHDFLVE